MKKNNESVSAAWMKILFSAVILVLCFFRNRVIPQDNVTMTTSGTVVTILLIIFCLRLVASAIGTLTGAGEKQVSPENLPEQPIKLWDHEGLFAYLEEEDIIDLILDKGNGETLKVGARSDYRRERYAKAEYFDKCYYIEEEEYTDLSDFIAQFSRAHGEGTVRVVYAGIQDMPVEIK